MSGIMSGNYKKFTYVPPVKPGELIDCTSYVKDFNERKFIHTGLDPSNDFNEKVDIITASRFIRLTPNFLKRVLSLMGYILSIILNTPEKTKHIVFLEDDSVKVSKMVYRGSNVLVVESKSQVGCRVLLNKQDLFNLQNLESSIFQSLYRKTLFTRPLIMKQMLQIRSFLKKNYTVQSKTTEELETYIMRIDQSLIEVARDEPNFISDIIMLNKKEIAKRCNIKEEEMICDDETTTPRTQREIMVSAPLRKCATKPMDHLYPSSNYTHNYPKHVRNDETISTLPSLDVQPITYQDLVMETCYSPIPSHHQTTSSGDVNDGPLFFNRYSPPPSPIQYLEDVPLENKHWNAKRQLFF